jgi:peptidoglycan hydrolase-like protein with peptidoglycan-binding domain
MIPSATIIRLALRLVANKDRLADMLGDALGKDEPPIDEKVEPPGPKEGSVAWLQESLNILANAGLKVDGEYGPATMQAVKDYQAARDLEVDGWAGVLTQAAIVEDLAEQRVT